MHVVFIVHDMHPNLTGIRHALTNFGHKCTFISEFVGPSEPEVCDVRIVRQAADVSRRYARELLSSLKPDLLVQRNFNGGYIEFWWVAEKESIPRFRYDQDPSQIPFPDCMIRPFRVLRFSIHLLYFRLRLGPHRRITPVKYWGKENKLNFSNTEHLPFPSVIRKSNNLGTSGEITVLNVAKHGQKGARVGWLLNSLRQAKQPFNLFIAGTTPSPNDHRKQRNYARLLRSIQSLGVRSQNVTIYENLDQGEMQNLYSASDLFVLPSKRHYMAISPLEAMSHGLPVLASSDGGAVSYIFPVGSEQIFRARSYRDFRKKLFRLLTDENLRKNLSGRALQNLKRTHSPEAFVDRLSKLANSK